MTLAKGLGGGIPLGALVAHQDVCCFEQGDQGGTFNGNAFATAVGCAVMEEIGKPGFLPQVTQTGHLSRRHLEALSRKHGCGGVRGGACFLRLISGATAARGRGQAFERGLLINSPRPDSLRFMPALTVTREEIDQMIGMLDEVLEQMEDPQID